MNKKQIKEQLNNLSNSLKIDIMYSVENNNKKIAIDEIDETIRVLKILKSEIARC